MNQEDLILAGANMMTDKGYNMAPEADALKFKAKRMLLTLVKYRDAGMSTYTYFWKNEEERVVSPFFNSEKEALVWVKEQ